ncbi:MAG: ABC transporter permease [Nitrospiraceae bacterium]|nr:MAG: ABC transporter permease [Nitrospiraceae bacterium]
MKKNKSAPKGMYIEILRYSFKAACKSIGHDKWINFLTILSVSIGLTILCAFVLINANMNSALQKWAQSFGVVVYLSEDISRDAEGALEEHFLKDNDIEEVNYISKDQAAEEIKKTLGQHAVILDVFNESPLPSSFELKLRSKFLDPARVREKAAQMQKLEGVQEVQYGEKWLSSLSTIAKTLKICSIVFGTAIFIAVTFITYSTIKIFLHRRRDEIETLKLLGASRSFIRLPFLIEGLFIGTLGGALSSLGILASYSFIMYKMVEFLPAMKFIMSSLPSSIYVVVPFGGAVMSLLGSFIAIGKIRY